MRDATANQDEYDFVLPAAPTRRGRSLTWFVVSAALVLAGFAAGFAAGYWRGMGVYERMIEDYARG